ncbi:hypothetical protein GCM10008024_41190 [Allgaiera indica]|uniref:Uncharacterized protein n=1 Tax=Allgaiera indica TaxID=765699 RepID=A0AAN4UVB9_9RHOB|nr:hypothetical protein GCM10008024_41190 [Allgaiera indica]
MVSTPELRKSLCDAECDSVREAQGGSLLKLTFIKTMAKTFSSVILACHFQQILCRAHPFPFGGTHRVGIAA